eukprot:Gb_01044 [translate_table: standard]
MMATVIRLGSIEKIFQVHHSKDRRSKWHSKWQGGAKYSFSPQLFERKGKVLFKFLLGDEPVITESSLLSVEEDVRVILEETGLLLFFNKFSGHSDVITRQFVDSWKNGRVTINGLDIEVNEGLITEVTGLLKDREAVSRDKMDQFEGFLDVGSYHIKWGVSIGDCPYLLSEVAVNQWIGYSFLLFSIERAPTRALPSPSLKHILGASGAFESADGRHRRRRKRSGVGEPMIDSVGSPDTDIVGEPKTDIVGDHRQDIYVDTDRLGRSHRQRSYSPTPTEPKSSHGGSSVE